LFSLPIPKDRYPPLNLSPQRQRQKTLETLVAVLLQQTEGQPVLFILEDLHWIDPSTLELLDLLIDQTPTAALCVLLTCRPAFQPPWSSRSYLTQMTLNRLSRSQIERMVEQVADGKPLPAEVLEQITEKTDGVPLFVEELTKAVLESDHLNEVDGQYELTGSLSTLAIPATLQDSLMARLDRLVTAKAVAQYAAVIGRQFSYELLQAVSQLDEMTLQRELGRLVKAELIYQRGLPPQTTYLFKHALVVDTAYESLLKSTRQQYHQRIAQVLEERFAETAEAQPELLAYHCTEAGLNEQAIVRWHQAGQRAAQHSANLEAVNHLTKGLQVLASLPDAPERWQEELALQITLGPVLIATKGYAAPEVERAYVRAHELCQQVGETPQLFPAIRGLLFFHVMRAEYHTARELGEQLLSLAQRAQDPMLLVEAHRALATVLYWCGEPHAAAAHAERGMAHYDPQQHRSLALRYGLDSGTSCLIYAGLSGWNLGYPDQARRRAAEALTLSQDLSHTHNLCGVLTQATAVHIYCRDAQVVQEYAEAVITLATEQSFPQWLSAGTVFQGWARMAQGQDEEGLARMQQGLDAWRRTETRLGLPWYLAMLAEAHGKLGQVDQGLHLLAEAQSMVDETGERWCEAELYRLKGVLLLQLSSDNHTEAETCFHQALDIARRQQAKSWELRAASSLARLWQSQGKRQDAYDLLAPVYGWFTEGFDTADLQEAKALLNELAA
ncbi:MAG: hypothetical protein O7G88_13465, partial [bacterium]|nr:hypothetical protein [bacterium]